MQVDAAASLDFLRMLYPEGPWVLTSIEVDRKGIATATFRPGAESAMATWLEAHNSTRNIYYSLNEPITDHDQKAKRTDLKRVNYLHVDLDPAKDKPLAAEQERIAGLLQALPGGIPEPSYVVYSGGGYNAIWKLQKPININGDLALAEEAKRYNLQLEVVLGGDHCHNIDRILRLPGTVNWPDAKKRARGRVAARAELRSCSGVAYPLTAFTPAPKLQVSPEGLTPGQAVQVSGNVQRISSVDDLGDRVSDRTKMLIVQGMDPDEPEKWTSRSEALFHVCCELVRADISDEMIYAVITDQDFRISSSVLDKGSKSHDYALRQIRQAKEHAIDPWLRKLNERYAVIGNFGGKCRVIEEVMDISLGRSRLTKQSFEDFRNRHLNVKVKTGTDKKGNPTYTQLGRWWLEHEQRRQYDTMVFCPGRDVPDAYNLWRGFACDAIPGVKHQGFLEHIRLNLCSGNEEHYNYIIGWMARCIQQPDSPGEVAIILRGGRGTGKSFFATVFGSLLGRHFLQIANSKHLVGNFNSHLRDCVVLFGDEAFFAGDKQHESTLKMLITEQHLAIESKGVDLDIFPNYIHLILASNNNWVVPAGTDERRFLVLDVSPHKRQDSAYFANLRAEMDEGGLSSLLHYLLTYDLTGYEVRSVPKTDALREQKELSFSPEEEWWFRKLEEGLLIQGHSEWSKPVLKDALLDEYLNYSIRVGIGRRSNATTLGRFLKKVCPPGWPQSHQSTRLVRDLDGRNRTERVAMYTFPDLRTCREVFDKEFGGPYRWPVIDFRPNPHPNQPDEDVL